MKTARKHFDCVAMKRAGAAQVYELTKDMTRAEELAFWKAEEAKQRAERSRTAKPRAVLRRR